MARTRPLIFLVAGEPSGDLLGARLMAALKEARGGAVDFAGLGGPLMQAEGLESQFDVSELALMGLVEVIGHIPRILRRIRETEAAARAAAPDLFISIDSPGFSLRVARRLKGAGFPLIHYVAPSVWAWKPGRAKKVAAYLDHLLCLLPFEPPYFERHGLGCSFVGHPVVETAQLQTDPEGLRASLGLAPEQPLLAVLPGSRRSEVERLMPVFAATVNELARGLPGLAAVIPTVPNVAALVREKAAAWSVPVVVVEGEQRRRDAFAASRAGLAASGTVTLEMAVAGLPCVIAYGANPITAAIVRRLLKVEWVSMASLVLGRQVQPECLQENCRPDRILAALRPLLSDGPERRRVVADGLEAARRLGLGGEAPSHKAATAVLDLLPAGDPAAR